jgi:hypothetical protein
MPSTFINLAPFAQISKVQAARAWAGSEASEILIGNTTATRGDLRGDNTGLKDIRAGTPEGGFWLQN